MSSSRQGWVYVFLLLVLVIGSLWPLPAWGQERSVEWQRFDVDITVHDDGTFTVVETMEIRFIGGPFRYGYREIPGERLEALTDIQVVDEAGPYEALPGDVQEGPPRTFSVTRLGRTYNIRWFFQPVSDTTRTFQVRYRVHGGLRAYAEGTQLWWKAVFPDRNAPVRQSVVTVRVPGPVQASAAYFVPARVEQLDPNTVRFVAEAQIPAGTPFEVRVEWPSGIVPVTPAPWQAAADAEAARLEQRRLWDQRWRPVANVLTLALGLLILVGGLGGLFLLWYTRGRDKPVPEVAEYLPEPPSDLPPGLVGTLLDETADLQDIMATLLDLARRGVLTIEERRDALGNRDFVFHLNGDTLEDVRPFERKVVEAVMEGERSRALSTLKNRFYQKIPDVQAAIYQACVEAGLFPTNPSTVRTVYLVMGVLLLLLGGGGFLLAGVVSRWIDTFGVIPFALEIVAVATILVGRYMPRKTEAGAEEAAKWRAFQRYLANLDRYGSLQQAEEVLDRYLPYAVAMGVASDFLQKFERALQAEGRDVVLPRWYRAYPIDPLSRSERVPGKGMERSPVEGGRDLSDLSRGVGRGLSNLSTSLGSMLSMAATTLASRPASSGSGGFTGGGSSGGGGGGGGGGGFG